MARAAAGAGWTCDRAPVADGGEGLLEALGGSVRRTLVTGPLGRPVEAEWRMQAGRAVIEMARASGLGLVGGPEGNDPLRASTTGTGQGVDVRSLPGAGAAGGLAGGLAAVGASLVPGFDLVADAIGLAERIEGADLVLTGEGFLDDQSFQGKAVGGVVGLAREHGVPVV